MIDLLKNRRSTRCYRKDKLRKEEIELILKAALLSPSSRNRRPWHFIVIEDKMILSKLSKCRTQGGGPYLKDAAAAIIVTANTSKTDVWIEDCSIATAIMQLEAEKIGIGSCWVQIRNRIHDDEITAEKYIKDLINIPEEYAVECILSLGYKGENKEAYKDEDIQWNKVEWRNV